MNNALLYLASFLVMALAVLFAVPYFVDWNSYRGVFEEEASRILGREVRVGGTVNLRLLPSPFVRFEKLRIADAGGEGGTSIFRAESFIMRLSVPPLLRGVLEANEVELKRPTVQLAVDKNGAGNWGTISLNPGLVPFLPRDVALQSVKLIDGVISVRGPDGTELVRLEDIDGELAAEALDGPFKFRGTVGWSDGKRVVRLATSRQDPSGDVRFKVAVTAAGSGNTYVLDGRVGDLTSRPRVEGDLTAKLSLSLDTAASNEGDEPPAAAPAVEAPVPPQKPGQVGGLDVEGLDVAVPAEPSPGGPTQFDLRAKLHGDATGFKLSDIAATLEQGGAPQLISGSAAVAWGEKLRLEVALASRWLDLDRFVAHGNGMAPFVAARGLFESFAALMPAEADTSASFEVDQLNLGGDAVSNVRLSASRRGGPLELKGLRANLPGGTRLGLDGVLKPGAAPRFDGALTLAGQSLLRFVGWGLKDKSIAEGRTDGPFALEGRLALGDGAIELTEASADIAAMPLAGEIKLGLGARNKLVVALEGSRVDVGQIRGGIVGLGSLQALLGGEAEQARDGGGSGPAIRKAHTLDLATTDVALTLRFAEIADGARVLRDVAARVSLEQGRLSMPALKFETPEGLAIDAEGEATDVPERPKGAIRGSIAAPTPAAAAALVRLLDLADDAKPVADRIGALAPFRVAGALGFGASGATDIHLSLDGTVREGRASGAVYLEGGRSDWRTKPVDATVTVENARVEQLLAVALGPSAVANGNGTEGAAPRPGRLSIKAAGTPAKGVLALASIASDGFAVDFNGRVALPSSGADVTGAVRVAVDDARSLLGFAGLPLGDGAGATQVAGSAQLTIKDGSITLAANELAVGAAKLGGRLTLARPEGKLATLNADLAIDRATFAGLLAPVLGRSEPAVVAVPPTAPAVKAVPTAQGKSTPGIAAPAPGSIAPLEVVSPIWPEAPFDLGALGEVEGRIAARIGTLALEPGLAIGDARLTAVLGSGGINVEALDGAALGGKLTSSFNIEKAAAGIGLAGKMRIDIASRADAPPPGDIAAFTLDFSGRALSPGALIADLKGKGEITVGDATLAGMTPSAVTAVAEQALAGKGPAGGDVLVQAIKNALKVGELKIGKITIPAELRDGALRLEKVQLDAEDGRSTFTTAIELATMQIDSEWQIEPKVARPAAQARVLLPGVTVVYVGKLKDLAALEPTISTGALERELTVRKMERDVEELERLRKLDQTRAKEEAERMKALEAERAKALRPPSPATAFPPQTSTPPAVAPSDAPPPGAGVPVDSAIQGGADATVPGPDDGSADGTGDAAAAQGLPAEQASVPPPTTSPTSRRRRPADEAWRPFQTSPY